MAAFEAGGLSQSAKPEMSGKFGLLTRYIVTLIEVLRILLIKDRHRTCSTSLLIGFVRKTSVLSRDHS